MALNFNTIVVYDFETGSVNPNDCELLQLAAVTINPRTLEVKDDDIFDVYLKPKDWSRVTEGALAKNKITKEIIDEKGVDLKLGWNDFVKWVQKYDAKKTFWTAPVSAGTNIKNFDRFIIERLCKEYGPWDDKRDESKLFSKRDSIDLLDILFLCFENRSDLDKYAMDTVRPYFGIEKEGGHNAKKDVLDVAKLIARFMNMFRNMSKGKHYKDSFKTTV